MFYLQQQNNTNSYALGNKKQTLGKHKANDIVILDSSIDDFQLEIYSKNDSLFLKNLGTPELVLLNGNPVIGVCMVNEDDNLIFGSTPFFIKTTTVVKEEQFDDVTIIKPVVDVPADDDATRLFQAADSASSSPTPKWTLKCQSHSIDDISIPMQAEFVIGRNTSCDFVISEGLLSRRHAQFYADDSCVQIKDLGSSNGTFINEAQVNAGIAQNGDSIGLGDVTFELILENSLAPIAEPAPQVTEYLQPNPEPSQTTEPETVDPLLNLNDAMASSSADILDSLPDEDESKKPSAVWQVPPTTTDGTVIIAATPNFPTLTGQSDPINGEIFELNKPELTIGRTPNNDIQIDEISISSSHAKIIKLNDQIQLVDLNSTNGTFVNDSRIDQQIIYSGDTIRLGQINLTFNSLSSVPATNIPTAQTTPKKAVTSTKKTNKTNLFAVGAVFIGLILIVSSYFYFDQSKTKSPEIEALALNLIWSKTLPDSKGLTAPIIQNINNDPKPEIIVSNQDGHVFVINASNGKDLFAVNLDKKPTNPFTVDLNNDGTQELVLSNNNGHLRVVNQVGDTLLDVKNKSYITRFNNMAATLDLNDDNTPDILAPSDTGLVAINGKDGSLLWSSAKHTKGKVLSKPIVNDINDDGILDFVSLTDVGQLLAMTVKNNKLQILWSIDVPPVLFASPTFINTGTSNLVIIATHQQGILAIDASSAKEVWRSHSKKTYFASPIALPSANDTSNSILLVSLDGTVITLNASSGAETSQLALSTNIQADPKLHDLNGDSQLDIILADATGRVILVDGASKKVLLSSAIPNAGKFVMTPDIGDINQDGMLDIVLTSPNGRTMAYEINRPYNL